MQMTVVGPDKIFGLLNFWWGNPVMPCNCSAHSQASAFLNSVTNNVDIAKLNFCHQVKA